MPGKVSCNYMPNVIEFLKRYLSASQVELLRETCFGRLLDMDEIICQGDVAEGIKNQRITS